MSDRAFTVAFGLSLAVHLLFLLTRIAPFNWLPLRRPQGPLQVIYDYEIAQQELRRLQDELARAKRESMTTGPAAIPTGQQPQIRIPDRPVLALTRNLPETLAGRSSLIDLTNLTEASQGDPVLLSYFSAIREQIQRAADRRGWVTEDVSRGLVTISFILGANGAIREVAVVAERSSTSATLQEIARRIVESAAPFPPFPPSIGEGRKTIVVPLEFLLGS